MTYTIKTVDGVEIIFDLDNIVDVTRDEVNDTFTIYTDDSITVSNTEFALFTKALKKINVWYTKNNKVIKTTADKRLSEEKLQLFSKEEAMSVLVKLQSIRDNDMLEAKSILTQEDLDKVVELEAKVERLARNYDTKRADLKQLVKDQKKNPDKQDIDRDIDHTSILVDSISHTYQATNKDIHDILDLPKRNWKDLEYKITIQVKNTH